MDKINGISKNITVIQPRRVTKDYDVEVYFRVSTKHKEQMDSFTIQAPGLTRLASAHWTWFVVDIFIYVASAKTDSYRPEFSRMIANVKMGALISFLHTKSISLFGHDAQEYLEAIRKIRASGKRIIFELDKIDTEAIGDELLISVIKSC